VFSKSISRLQQNTFPGPLRPETDLGYPRIFLGHRFVYALISSRAGGLSIGINMNPDKICNFNCVYCEVDRSQPSNSVCVDVDVVKQELKSTLDLVSTGAIARHPQFQNVPESLLNLRHVAFSGDGEPTLCNDFARIVESVVHIRAQGNLPFFKMVLMTNASGLHHPQVIDGLAHFTARDEIWAKLEVGTQEAMNRVNQTDCSLALIMKNILDLARKRPVIIQSLFPEIDNGEPSQHEIEEYVQRLTDLKQAGAQISLVQVYSSTRQPATSKSGHLSLKTLNNIASRVQQSSGLRVQVF
jgi:wyosine [tRNA(Phe)-imidazoG37] synthetase (radical SAM superfamily)